MRTARDAVRAPLLAVLQERMASEATAGVGVGTVVTALDAIAVDGLRHRPEQPLWERRQELASFALAPFVDGMPAVSTDVAAVSKPPDGGRSRRWSTPGRRAGPSSSCWCARRSRGATGRRCGRPSCGCSGAARSSGGSELEDDLVAEALDALGDAWFFGLPIAEPGGDAAPGISETDTLYLRYVAAHPGSSGEQIRRGLAVAHLSQVNRTLQRLEGHGVVEREPGHGRANAWGLTRGGPSRRCAAGARGISGKDRL